MHILVLHTLVNAVCSFINQSFQSLRSAEGAFDMLHNFKNIKSRDTINATMMKKFNEILTQFEREVENISLLFQDHKEDPPISRNQPPVAGAISWSHSLFMRIKHTVLRFQTMKELIDSEAGKSVSTLCLYVYIYYLFIYFINLFILFIYLFIYYRLVKDI